MKIGFNLTNATYERISHFEKVVSTYGKITDRLRNKGQIHFTLEFETIDREAEFQQAAKIFK